MGAGAVDAQEDPVGDAGPARVLGAAVEARLKRRQRDGRAEAASSATLPLLHPLPQPGSSIPRGPTALSGPSPRPRSPLPGRPAATARPGAHRGLARAQTAAEGKQPDSPRYLVRRRCPEPLEESLDLRLAGLRRHDLSFPDTTAATGAGRIQSAQGSGRSTGAA